VLNPLKEKPSTINKKFNPLKHKLTMRKLNPYHENKNKILTEEAKKN